MSVYEKRYNVSAGMVSHYTDDPAEALRLYNRGLGLRDQFNRLYPDPYIVEGYAEYKDVDKGWGDYATQVTRRSLGKVLPSTLEYLVQRAKVQKMLEEIR